MMRLIRVTLFMASILMPFGVSAKPPEVKAWGVVRGQTERFGASHHEVFLRQNTYDVFSRIALTLTSSDRLSTLVLYIKDTERNAITGSYFYDEVLLSAIIQRDDELWGIVDGRVDISMDDATIFPPRYRVHFELYMLPSERTQAWKAVRHLYAIPHPDDAVYVSGRVTLQPELVCETSAGALRWLDDPTTPTFDVMAQALRDVEPACRSMAGVLTTPSK